MTVLGTHSDHTGAPATPDRQQPNSPAATPGTPGLPASEHIRSRFIPEPELGWKRSCRTNVVPAARAVPGWTPRSAPGSSISRPPCPHPHPLGWRAHSAQEKRRHWDFVCTLGPGAPASPCGRREQLLHNRTRVQAVRESRQRLTCFIPAHEVKFSPCTNYL